MDKVNSTYVSAAIGVGYYGAAVGEARIVIESDFAH